MARGPYWLCSELRLIERNLDKTDAEIAEMLPRRSMRSVESARLKYGIRKRSAYPPYPTYPQAERGRLGGTNAVHSG